MTRDRTERPFVMGVASTVDRAEARLAAPGRTWYKSPLVPVAEAGPAAIPSARASDTGTVPGGVTSGVRRDTRMKNGR